LSEVFIRHHGCLLTAAWWRAQAALAPEAAAALEKELVRITGFKKETHRSGISSTTVKGTPGPLQ